MTDSVHYYPDGKGGFIGTKGSSSPAAGETLTHNLGGLGVVGGQASPDLPVTYSSDGKGGFIGAVGGERYCLWYWFSDGTNPETWVPYGTHVPVWNKVKVLDDYPGTTVGERPRLLLDSTQAPHIFWKINGTEKIVHMWYSLGVWYSEDIVPPEGYLFAPWFDWDLKIDSTNKIHLIYGLYETEYVYPPDWPDIKIWYRWRDPATGAWSSPEVAYTPTPFFWCDPMSLALDPFNRPHIIFTDRGAPGDYDLPYTGAGPGTVRAFKSSYGWMVDNVGDNLRYPHIMFEPSSMRSIVTGTVLRSQNHYNFNEIRYYQNWLGAVPNTWTYLNPPPSGLMWVEWSDDMRRSLIGYPSGYNHMIEVSIRHPIWDQTNVPDYIPVEKSLLLLGDDTGGWWEYYDEVLAYPVLSFSLGDPLNFPHGYNPQEWNDIPRGAAKGFQNASARVQILNMINGELIYNYYNLSTGINYNQRNTATRARYYDFAASPINGMPCLIVVKPC